MLSYREIPPPLRLAEAVECFWITQPDQRTAVTHRVLPDGCADILFSGGKAKPALQLVGPMSRFADVTVKPEEWFVGVRFRPGMWRSQVFLQGDQAADQMVPLEHLWGARARKLQEQMGDSQRAEEGLALLANALLSAEKRSPVQQSPGISGTPAWMRADTGTGEAGRCEYKTVPALVHTGDGIAPKFTGAHSAFPICFGAGR